MSSKNQMQSSLNKDEDKKQNENLKNNGYTTQQGDIEKQIKFNNKELYPSQPQLTTQNFGETDQLDKKAKINKNEKEEDAESKEYINYGMNFLFRFFFLHILKLALKLKKKIDYGKRLDFNDVPDLKNHEKVEFISKVIKEQVQHAHENKIKLTVFKMMRVVLRMFLPDVLLCLFFICFEYVFRLYSSVSMQILIENIQKGDEDEILKETIIFSVCVFASGIICQLNGYFSTCLSAKLRLGFVATLYSKVISLSQYSIKQADLSKIINIVSNDMNLIEMKLPFMFNALMAPLTLTGVAWILIDRHGPLGIIIIIVLVGCLPIQNIISKKASTFIGQKNKYSEERIKLTHEIIDGIKMIKMYGWEIAFKKLVNIARSNETKYLLKQISYNYIAMSLSFASSLFSATISFSMIYYLDDSNELNTAKIFASMSLIMFLRIQVMLFVGYSLSLVHEFKIFLQRFISIITIQNYSMINLDISQETNQEQNLFNKFEQEEESLEQFSSRLNTVCDSSQVCLSKFSAWWNKEGQNEPVLKNLNINFNENKLYAIVGRVGSGKSSLLYTIIKEMPAYRGIFSVKGSVTYSKQEPHIFPGTIRENILFGKPYHKEWYDQVVSNCCLLTDFEQFPNEDNSEIGEKGINLSGGQRARISLARAVYQNPDILLLDDPLSAVDSKVAKSLVQNVFKTLLKNKLIILVTHQISQAKYFDHIILLENGSIDSQGDYNAMKENLDLLSEKEGKEKNKENEQDDEQSQINESGFQLKLDDELEDKVRQRTYTEKQGKEQVAFFVNEEGKGADVTTQTYTRYFTFSGKTWQYIWITIAFIFNEGVLTAYNRLLAFFDSEDQINKENIFILLGILTIVFFVCQSIKYVSLGRSVINTNTAIHTKMVENVVRSPITFFEQTESGIILNRFTNDVGILDNMIHFTFQYFFHIVIYFLSNRFLDSLEGPLNFINLILTVSVIQPYFLIVGVIEIFIMYKWLKFNKNLIQQTKILDLQSKSPVFSFFSQTLSSMDTINVFNQNQAQFKTMCEKANMNIRCNILFSHISRMFGAYTQYIASVFSVIGIFLVTQVFDIDQGLVGQSLIYLTLMTDYINWAVRQIISMDSAMSSVSRSFQICELESENELILPEDSNLCQKQWPTQGQVSFQNVHLKYRRDLEDTLKGVNFKIEPGQKIGCVGRTGAGKSSLIECLFRMREKENVQQDGVNNKIIYDQVDISKVGLHTLRSSISIIPQAPFIFYGSIRRNLDPLDQYTDEEIISVLKETQLYEVVSSLPNGLQSDITDINSIFSVGQKQLICLARSILKNSKLIIMDEATANMDMATDQFIQKTIKNKFSQSSVLTIAHRLNTVADYDKVLVMDQGRVVEFESPFKLLTDDVNSNTITNDGYFAQLVKHTGELNSKTIFQLAKNHYFNNQQLKLE